MMILAPFSPYHLEEIELQRATPKDVVLFSDPAYGEALATQGDSYSAFHDGELTACLGVCEVLPGVGWAWAMFSQKAGRILPALSIRARAYLRSCRFRRIEGHIDPSFPESVRWAHLMHFEFEGVMKKFAPNGDPRHMYAWTRSD